MAPFSITNRRYFALLSFSSHYLPSLSNYYNTDLKTQLTHCVRLHCLFIKVFPHAGKLSTKNYKSKSLSYTHSSRINKQIKMSRSGKQLDTSICVHVSLYISSLVASYLKSQVTWNRTGLHFLLQLYNQQDPRLLNTTVLIMHAIRLPIHYFT